MRWAGAVVGVVWLAGVAMLSAAHAQTPAGPLNGDFEAGAVGWAPADSGTLDVDASQPVGSGSASGHVRSNGAGIVSIRTQYWLTAAAPTNVYTLSVAVRIPAATMTSVTARLDLVDDNGVALASRSITRPGPTAGYVTITTTNLTAPPNTDYALVVITGNATVAGARFSVDDLVITEVVTPPPAPTPLDPVPPPDDPAPEVGASGSRSSSPAILFPTPPPPPAALPVRLGNGAFDTNLSGWSIAQGRAWTDSWVPGQGPSMVLYTPAATTVWAEQTIGEIRGGEWYQASALLSTRGGVHSGWLRLAWHPSEDGRGAAIGQNDTLAVTAYEASMVAPNYLVVGTGPVQAPAIAGSVTVRLLLRGDGGDSWLIADDVTFGPAEAAARAGAPAQPPVIAAMPVATAAPPLARVAFADLDLPMADPGASPPTRAASAPAGSVVTPRAVTTPRVGAAAAGSASLVAEDVVAPGVADTQRAIRMTQILPDPTNPGRDNDYEWIELTNLGATPASVEGMTLRDNSGAVTLPALVIPAGGMLVVTARLAEVPGATAFRLSQSIGNGLGNAGDRLVLASADGRQVDAFSYGDDITYEAGARITAPGTGRAIERRFGPDGIFREAAILEQPQPGRPRGTPAAASGTPAVPGAVEATTNATGSLATWAALLFVGGGLLGGAALQRVAAIIATRRG